MTRLSRLIIIVLALFMLAGCDDVGPGSGGGGDEVGVAEDAGGMFNLACLKIAYTVQGGEVLIRLYLNGQLIYYQFLSPLVTEWPFEYHSGNYSVQGSVIYNPGSPSRSARLLAGGISIGCNGQTTQFYGTIGTW